MATYCVTMYADVEADSLEAAFEVANELLSVLAETGFKPLGHVDYSDVTEVDDI